MRFDPDFLHVTLADGRVISTPMAWYPQLREARLADPARHRFICDRTAIEWPTLDNHLSIGSMLATAAPERKAA